MIPKSWNRFRTRSCAKRQVMFYEPDKRDLTLLPRDPFKAIVAPRPIGWVTFISLKGEVNLAPYTLLNGVNGTPNVVIFAREGRKDSVTFIAETKEFVCNLATWDLREQMNATSAPLARGVNEMERAGLTPALSRLVRPRALRVLLARSSAGSSRSCHRYRRPTDRLPRGVRPHCRRLHRQPLCHRWHA